ncbi:RluA family pseudouridine synthase [Treponema pedis]|uniref:RNA pseudouridylate synthase n=1 Tax=Treponema pedis str. T A4 TaxID=1291379 RepID=S6A8T1_9SPIR|nr:RNA pseudouridine synthase [Treponema pedis]AGT44369.1 RNA pseudouridylate synthase [Treponema pedis str. T A4]
MKKNKERVLFEDEYLAIAAKNTGEDSQIFFKEIFEEKEYSQAVNRLDKPVSGLVIIAFSENIHTKINKLFQNKKVGKEYWAICKKNEAYGLNIKQFTEDYLSFNHKIQKGFCGKTGNSKKASLYWEVTGMGENYNFLRVNPVTGRTHQIRIQLSNLGMPIKGDIKYGFNRTEKSGGIRLHAYSLKFIHPITNRKLEYSALPPFRDKLWEACIEACIKKEEF